MSPDEVRKAVVGQPPMLYRWLMSGRTSLSTRTGTYSRLIRSITPACEYVVSSITWHQWHQTAEMESRMGRPVCLASSKASCDHGCQLISEARFGRGEKWNSAAASVIGTRLRFQCDLNERCRRLYREALAAVHRRAEG